MPLVRKLTIVAAIDGLLLHPVAPRAQNKAVQIRYATNELTVLSPRSEEEVDKSAASLEAHGVVGLFTIATSSYLIGITGRKQVAAIRGKPVYVITNVVLIPLGSQRDATAAIEQANRISRQKKGQAEQSDTSDDEDDHLRDGDEDDVLAPAEEGEGLRLSGHAAPAIESTVLQDVIGKRGQYGRFAERWFSKKGWSMDQKRLQGMSSDATAKDEGTGPRTESPGGAKAGQTVLQEDPKVVIKPNGDGLSDGAVKLLPKLLRTTRLLLSSRSFFFSYDMDITRRLSTQTPTSNESLLFRQVDPLFFWNRHLMDSFVNVGVYAFVLPLMQGFVGQRAFAANAGLHDIEDVKNEVDEVIQAQETACECQNPKDTRSNKNKDFILTLISRRSVRRPGLRYLRRGIDDDGHAANTVETEQILSDPTWSASSSIYSFTQIRGSIPLYFSQTPYSFKPVPVPHKSFDANHAAFKRHLANIMGRYGGLQIATLVDKHGGEAKIGEEYQKHTLQFNEENGANQVGFEWFDFHDICRGMKFENVSILMDSLAPVLDSYGITIEKGGKVQSTQSGILRTNCMDCLDRTNVVQSACGQRALEQQLAIEGITLDLRNDASTSWFNTLWADNGDAISKQYASTAALKGDYTRTRKRDYRGALNDFGLSINRYFNNIVNDYFSQAAVDFLLGNVSDDVFDDFEANMMSHDPATSMRKVRQSAIDTSTKIVVASPSEDLAAGWTLLTPRAPNTVRGSPLEEIVVLLTDAALYAVRFDWTTEKVSSFERVDLRSIVSMTRGTYISSVFTTAQCDPRRNVGFAVRYRPGKEDVSRVNTRSLSTAPTPRHERSNPFEDPQSPASRSPPATPPLKARAQPDAATIAERLGAADLGAYNASPLEIRTLAFKVLPARAGDVGEGAAPMGEEETCRMMVDEIARLAHANVEEGDVIGLAEARRRTGLLEQWGHSLRMLVWG